MEFGLKWVHMAQYELILRLDGALWLRIILKPLLTPKKCHGMTKNPQRNRKSSRVGQEQIPLDVSPGHLRNQNH